MHAAAHAKAERKYKHNNAREKHLSEFVLLIPKDGWRETSVIWDKQS